MNILNYIRGDRKGKNAHNLEREMLAKPFLYEAVEGFEKSGDPATLTKEVNELYKEIASLSAVKKSRWWLWVSLAVAGVVVLVLLYIFIFRDNFSRRSLSSEELPQTEQRAGAADKSAAEHPESPNGGEAEVTAIAQPEDDDLAKDGDKDEPESTLSTEKEAEKEAEEKLAKGSAEGSAESDKTDRSNKAESGAVGGSGERDNAGSKSSSVGASGAKLKPVLDLLASSESNKDKKETSPRTGVRRYNEYLSDACTLSDSATLGAVVMSFWVNDYGRPSTIRILSSPSVDANREMIRLLDSGPEWFPTQDTVTVTIRLRR